MYGPTRIFWANLTQFSLQYSTTGECRDCVGKGYTTTVDRTACVAPFKCDPGNEPGFVALVPSCAACAPGSISDGIDQCSPCTDVGKIANAGQSACEPCVAGTQPAVDRSVCAACFMNTGSRLGVECVQCEAGRAANEQHTACSDISLLEGPLTDSAVLADVLSEAPNLLPTVRLAKQADEAALVDGSASQLAMIDEIRQQVRCAVLLVLIARGVLCGATWPAKLPHCRWRRSLGSTSPISRSPTSAGMRGGAWQGASRGLAHASLSRTKRLSRLRLTQLSQLTQLTQLTQRLPRHAGR
jgi:hypothetical protein